ncbi:MAG: hypothetical protein V1735_01025 [Nanoarchaeota archaeon]
MANHLDTHLASDRLRPLVERLRDSFTFSDGDDMGESFSDLERPMLVITLDPSIEDIIREIGATGDQSAIPVLLPLLTTQSKDEGPPYHDDGSPFMHYAYLTHGDRERINRGQVIVDPSSSPNWTTLHHNVMAALQEITDASGDKDALLQRYPDLAKYVR